MISPYRLTREERDGVVERIARRMDLARRVVNRSSRTDAQLVAILRDGRWCQYHLRVRHQLREMHDAHHLDGRTPSGDVPHRIICLCYECHHKVHNGGPPTGADLISVLTEITEGL